MRSVLPLLVFDFDGVISESVHDSFRTALNTFITLYPDHGFPLHGPVNPAENIFQFEKLHPEIYHAFRNLMPFGNRAEDYYVILRIIDTGHAPEISNQEAYDRYKAGLSGLALEQYHRTFYDLRRLYQKAPETWVRLMPAFPGVVQAVQTLSKKYRLAIATSKDFASIRLQLKAYGLTRYFPKKYILDKEISHSKQNHLKRLQAELRIPFKDIHFIDDKFIHLLDVKSLGVHCYLAAWGFNTEREHRLAEEHGFHVLTLNQLPDL